MGRRRKSKLPLGLAGGLSGVHTAFAGASLLVETYRQAGIGEQAERVLPPKRSPKGLTPGQLVECLVVGSALGMECLEDIERLRQDPGLSAMLGYQPPAPETARQWLDRFHEEALLADRPQQGAFLPLESSGLAGLGEVNRRVVHAYVEGVQPGQTVTLDVDAHLVETTKTEAKVCYEGYKAFQPMVVSWAETGLVLTDEFREGNVPASVHSKEQVDRAFETLPPGAWTVQVRSDSAAYEPEGVLDHWHRRGWGFAVSADLSPQLKEAIRALPETAWQAWAEEAGGQVREWAEVPYVPERRQESKKAPVYRYLAIRVRRHQGVLFDDGEAVRHFAVVTNWWDAEGRALLEWHRGKQGTVEHVHHVLKNELAAGTYPSGKHGANAAWLRLQVITANLLELLKAVALPPEYAKARPKRLRFAVFTHVGELATHAHRTLLRVVQHLWESLLRPARDRLGLAWEGA